jgi:hypothetical protein
MKLPKNFQHFKKLIPFTKEIIQICNENNIDPVIYGSYAHFYHTEDKSLNVNDIDMILSKKYFPKIAKAIKKRIRAKIIFDGGTLIIKKENLIVELDSPDPGVISDKDLVKRKFREIDFYGTKVKIAEVKDLEKIYPMAFEESLRNKGKVLEKVISLEKHLGREVKRSDKMKNKEVCDEIYKVLYSKPEVIAIFNNGSAIVGMDFPGSDVDFVIIVKKSGDKRKVRNLFRKNFKILKNEEDPDIEVEEQYEVAGKRADPTIISKKDMGKKVYDLNKSSENFLNLQHFIKHKIVDAVAIYDEQCLMPKWKKEVEKYPRKIMKEIYDSQITCIKEELFYWRHHSFRNEFQFRFEQWEVIKAICQALYAKNNQMFMLPYKRLHVDLKNLKPNLEKEMYALIRGKNTHKTIQKKIKIVEKILEKLQEWK